MAEHNSSHKKKVVRDATREPERKYYDDKCVVAVLKTPVWAL